MANMDFEGSERLQLYDLIVAGQVFDVPGWVHAEVIKISRQPDVPGVKAEVVYAEFYSEDKGMLAERDATAVCGHASLKQLVEWWQQAKAEADEPAGEDAPADAAIRAAALYRDKLTDLRTCLDSVLSTFGLEGFVLAWEYANEEERAAWEKGLPLLCTPVTAPVVRQFVRAAQTYLLRKKVLEEVTPRLDLLFGTLFEQLRGERPQPGVPGVGKPGRPAPDPGPGPDSPFTPGTGLG